MSRSYANILTAIWSDVDFCDLSAGAQRTYFMLVTQPDIAACGTLPLTMRRWSNTLPTRERRHLGRWIDELAQNSFVIVDAGTEELLVRTFAKHDGGYKNTKRLAAVISTAGVIRSKRIRATLSVELTKLGVGMPNGSGMDRPSIAHPTPIDPARVVVTEVSTESTTLIPQTGEPSPSDDVEPPPWCSKHVGGTDDPCGPCGAAVRTNKRWHADREKRRQFEREQARKSRERCPDCHGSGWLEDGKGDPAGKCDHRRTA